LPETNERDGQYQLELAESARCGRLAVTELLARVGGSSVTANCPGPTKEAAISTWLWVLIIVVVVVLVFGVMRRRGR